MESELSKATQLGPRIAIVPLESSGVKRGVSLKCSHPQGIQETKGPYLLIIIQFVLWGPVPSDQRQVSLGEIMEKTPLKAAADTHVLGH